MAVADAIDLRYRALVLAGEALAAHLSAYPASVEHETAFTTARGGFVQHHPFVGRVGDAQAPGPRRPRRRRARRRRRLGPVGRP
jgi:hypothetical protein